MQKKEATPQGDTDQQPQGADQQQGITGQADDEGQPGTDWQAQARKWEARAKKDAKALEALKQQVNGLISPEQVHSTEQELAASRGEAEAAKAEALRYRVALEQGLPPDLARRLVGDDEEALVADAKALKGLLKPAKATPDAKAGTAPESQPPTMTPDQALRAAIGMPATR